MNDSSVAPWRDKVAKAVMLTLALAASIAFASASRAVTAAPPETKAVEIWRMLGYLVFSAIFILLALRPRKHPGLWELSFLHKAGVAAFLIAVSPRVSAGVAAMDGVLALAIAVCYVLTKGYRAWNVTEPRAAIRAATRRVSHPVPELAQYPWLGHGPL